MVKPRRQGTGGDRHGPNSGCGTQPPVTMPVRTGEAAILPSPPLEAERAGVRWGIPGPRDDISESVKPNLNSEIGHKKNAFRKAL